MNGGISLLPQYAFMAWRRYDHTSISMCFGTFYKKICPLGAELLHADRQKDMKKLTVASRNFANATTKQLMFYTKKLLLCTYRTHKYTLWTNFIILNVKHCAVKTSEMAGAQSIRGDFRCPCTHHEDTEWSEGITARILTSSPDKC
jgi:hypothetical protein